MNWNSSRGDKALQQFCSDVTGVPKKYIGASMGLDGGGPVVVFARPLGEVKTSKIHTLIARLERLTPAGSITYVLEEGREEWNYSIHIYPTIQTDD